MSGQGVVLLLAALAAPVPSARKVASTTSEDADLWVSKQSAKECIDTQAADLGRELERSLELIKQGKSDRERDRILASERRPLPEICTEGVLAKLTNGTLVVIVRGSGATAKEKTLRCDDLTPIRVTGGQHEGKIGCIAGSKLAEP
jgi:hypothetical protein